MYVKELKRAAALTLSAVLALGNIPVGGIMEAFAESKPGPVYGEKGEDFIKVRLHGTGGTFLNALKLEKKDRNPSTPSDATPNDATPSDLNILVREYRCSGGTDTANPAAGNR